MPADSGNTLQSTVDSALVKLRAVTEADASRKREGNGWSPKQELGHLIDSASNNHLRFVRASLEARYNGPSYDQNGSVRLHAYHDLAWASLVDFWYRYNSLLAHLVARIPEERLAAECIIGSGAPVTLGFLLDDYIAHMRHHLDHITGIQ